MVSIYGAFTPYERRIREALSSFPPWFVEAGRVARINVVRTVETDRQKAIYHHETRDIDLLPSLGEILRWTLAHEWSHAIDDARPSGSPHRFSRSDAWMSIWRQQSHFLTSKYRDEPQEYFADCLSRALIQGIGRFQLANPYEGAYIAEVVIPKISG